MSSAKHYDTGGGMIYPKRQLSLGTKAISERSFLKMKLFNSLFDLLKANRNIYIEYLE